MFAIGLLSLLGMGFVAMAGGGGDDDAEIDDIVTGAGSENDDAA